MEILKLVLGVIIALLAVINTYLSLGFPRTSQYSVGGCRGGKPRSRLVRQEQTQVRYCFQNTAIDGAITPLEHPVFPVSDTEKEGSRRERTAGASYRNDWISHGITLILRMESFL
ncbi:hypothetical protein MAPG_01451 [Magnaporthiopsis poae ATCC 64411]|uniref:Uncharacterized protein n=1 Tax=Magnaporthiopsis poae (strain ATCC 64411 / 73-15) TaxID=644358 RepID=A0A0C4DNQ7_MAGP6|nr:hypothetical protein MAPG_01451 [Magnaporthiopsis poae ATCC 64411]